MNATSCVYVNLGQVINLAVVHLGTEDLSTFQGAPEDGANAGFGVYSESLACGKSS